MVTAVPPLAILMFAGPIRTPKDMIKDFELSKIIWIFLGVLSALYVKFHYTKIYKKF